MKQNTNARPLPACPPGAIKGRPSSPHPCQCIRHPQNTTLFSRRSRRARYAARGGRNDLIWLLAFGGGVIALAAAFFLFSNSIGGGSACSKPLAPLGDNTPLSSEAFQNEDAGLGVVVSLAQAGDRAGAEDAFYGDVHNFTHNVDKPLREVDSALGKDLCHAVLDLEEALTSNISALNLSNKVQRVRSLLADASVALGYDRPT